MPSPTSLRLDKAAAKTLSKRAAQTGAKQAEIVRAGITLILKLSPDELIREIIAQRTESRSARNSTARAAA